MIHMACFVWNYEFTVLRKKKRKSSVLLSWKIINAIASYCLSLKCESCHMMSSYLNFQASLWWCSPEWALFLRQYGHITFTSPIYRNMDASFFSAITTTTTIIIIIISLDILLLIISLFPCYIPSYLFFFILLS